MRQIVQHLGTGKITVAEVPEPIVGDRRVKIRTLHSLISAGTERSKVEMGAKSLIGKARARPDLVSKVIKKARTEGLWSTFQTVQNRLADASPLGYSLSGIVTEVGREAQGVRPGDLVAAAGAGFANHAESVVVPHTLVARVPDGADAESAAFATVGAIALQGVRVAAPLIGETFLVIGLGLIGQITVQLLQANGVRVICSDLVGPLVERAVRTGAIGVDANSDLMAAVLDATDGRGADGVIITASTASNEPIEIAGEVTREKGRVVVVGAVGLNVPREPYYMKEIDLRISRSYGPGRYDYRHEEEGSDYPFGYVRFTEGRNMQTVLDLVAQKKLDVAGLVTHRFAIDEAEKAYNLLSGKTAEPYLGILISYPEVAIAPLPPRAEAVRAPVTGDIAVSFIGAGNYATSKLLPALRDMPGVNLARVATSSGRSAADIAKRFGFQACASDAAEILDGSDDVVFIATRHSSHAPLVNAALKAGKHVFVEKPLCVLREQIEELAASYHGAGRQLCVGFNRRFAPFAQAALDHLGKGGARLVTIRVNAGRLEGSHWSQDPREGGRVVGEACHFVDLAARLTGSVPVSVFATPLLHSGESAQTAQNTLVHIQMRNGALASIAYFAEGAASLGKEYVECHRGGLSAVIDDFKELRLYRDDKRIVRKAAQDKGQKNMVAAFIESVKSGKPAVAPSALFAVSDATIAIVESARLGVPVAIADYGYLDPA